MSEMKSLAKDTAIYGLSSIIGKFLNYLLVPLYTYALARTADYGIVTNIYAWTALLLVLCGLFTSVMWASIFNLATEGLGKYTAQASGIFMMMVVGGGVLPVVQNFFADIFGYMPSYFVYFLAVAYMFYYALIGCKNVNKDIPVD